MLLLIMPLILSIPISVFLLLAKCIKKNFSMNSQRKLYCPRIILSACFIDNIHDCEGNMIERSIPLFFIKVYWLTFSRNQVPVSTKMTLMLYPAPLRCNVQASKISTKLYL